MTVDASQTPPSKACRGRCLTQRCCRFEKQRCPSGASDRSSNRYGRRSGVFVDNLGALAVCFQTRQRSGLKSSHRCTTRSFKAGTLCTFLAASILGAYASSCPERKIREFEALSAFGVGLENLGVLNLAVTWFFGRSWVSKLGIYQSGIRAPHQSSILFMWT